MRKVIMLALLPFIAGCQFNTYQDAAGVTYVKGQVGLGIDNKLVPNAVEFDVPAMRTKVVSPVLEHTADIAFKATGGVIKWVNDAIMFILPPYS